MVDRLVYESKKSKIFRRQEDGPKTLAIRGFRVHKPTASNVKPCRCAFIGLVVVGLSVDENVDFGERDLVAFAQWAGWRIPHKISMGADDIAL